MAEEPRRSGRSTKGQHPKNQQDLHTLQHTKRKAQAQAKASKRTSKEQEPDDSMDDEADEIIRCICGEYDEEDEARTMICCDKCSAWQHTDCMGLNPPLPDEYYCEQCKPEDHKELLDKITRGEKPWEEAANERARLAEEKKSRRKKGGRRGRKSVGRPSDVKSEISEDVNNAGTPAKDIPNVNQPATPPELEKQSNAAVANEAANSMSQKRKFDDHKDATVQEPGPKPKLQRLSTTSGTGATTSSATPTSPVRARKSSVPGGHAVVHGHNDAKSPAGGGGGTSAAAAAADYLTVARKNVANALIKTFVEQAALAEKQGTFTVTPGLTKEAFGEKLGFEIEKALYKHLCGGSGAPNEAYREQMRTILFNVRQNPSLRDSLLVGSITPDMISTMSTQDMARKELRQKDDEIKREAERQHIIVQEQGPRIRRTHKGEELVEDDSQLVGTESVFSHVPTRRDTMTTDTAETHSAGSPRAPSTAASPSRPYSGHGEAGNGTKQRPESSPIDTRASPGAERRPSFTQFNIQDVWSSVQSPGATHHDQRHFDRSSTGAAQAADADIDHLLRDEEVESPPYSPKDVEEDPTIIWRGSIVMNGGPGFSAAGRHAGGADLSGKIPWNQLVPRTMRVDGRIETQLASNYLCGLRFSQTTDVTVLDLTPSESPADKAEFDKIFNYFIGRNRYGVVGKHLLSAVKDVYVVPVEAGAGRTPDFIGLLENSAIEDPVTHRRLLITFVVRTVNPNLSHETVGEDPHAAQPAVERHIPQKSESPAVAAAVTTTGPLESVSSISAPQPTQVSPVRQTQPPAQSGSSGPEQHMQSQSPQQLTGRAAATQVLGALATSPAVEMLLRHAPNADVEQLKVVADILSQNPAAANDYQALTNAIVKAKNGL